jgi:flagellar hook protein FlgE
MSFDIALSGIQAINEQLEHRFEQHRQREPPTASRAAAPTSPSVRRRARPTAWVGSLTQNIGQNGSTQTTGRGLDAAIDGRGFFVSRDNQGTMRTAASASFRPTRRRT